MTADEHLNALVYLGTWDGPMIVLDGWQDPARPLGSLAVVTVRDGINLATAWPFIPWANLLGIAWGVTPAETPEGRYLEAVRQERERAQQRFADHRPMQVWP